MKHDQVESSQIAYPPPKRVLTAFYIPSLAIAIFIASASIVALLYPDVIYPTEEVRRLSIPNELVNLLVVLPSLLGSIWLTRRGRLAGLLFWPGALFVIFYNSLAAVIILPVNIGFLLNLLLLALSSYTMIALIAVIDAGAVRRQLAGAVPERLAGGALMVWGSLFALLVFGALIDPLLQSTAVAIHDRALHVADLMIAPALILGGYLLWRRRALGYVVGAGLLFQVNMLFVGVIVVLVLQPLLSSGPLPVADIVVLAAMWFVGLVPFALFLRGIWSKEV